MMRRNASEGRQLMPQVSITVDLMVCQRGEKWRAVADPDVCKCVGKFFRRHTERAASITFICVKMTYEGTL